MSTGQPARPTVYGLLLAAGSSERVGQPKQLLDWHGQPLVCHVAAQARASRLAGLVIVTGHAGEAVQAALAAAGSLHVVHNADYAQGQASSLRAGLEALPANAAAAMVLLVDQPRITAALLDSLLDAYAAAHERDPALAALIPHSQNRRGNPVILARRLFAEAQALEGDQGARPLLDQHDAHVCWQEVPDPAVVQDIDTYDDYLSLLSTTA
jgi:molybdenum cofactor cytidylyltransferase